MAEKVDDDFFKQYERTALLILPYLPECLRETYRLYISGKGNQIGEEISKNILKDINPSAPDAERTRRQYSPRRAAPPG